MYVTVCPNPDHKTTLTNLRLLANKSLVKNTMKEICNV